MPLKTILEGLLWTAAIAPALFNPAPLHPLFTALESGFRRLARRQILACALLALTVLVGRGALLLVWDFPQPVVLDEYGYLLQADTFASGRLTTPTHPLAEFFTVPYILERPSYNAKYPPGQGLALGLGQALLGHPWFGVWLSCGLLAALIGWALQGWFPPEWALAGAIFVLPFCLFTHTMNSYWGGAVAGIGGALMVGAFPRLAQPAASPMLAAIFALGASILAATRPFEGLLLALPLIAALLFRPLSARHWIAFGLTAAAGAAFLCTYNAAVTGNPFQLPYLEYEKQYPMATHFSFLSPPPQHSFTHTGMIITDHWERAAWQHTRDPYFPIHRAKELLDSLGSFLGSRFVFLLPLLFAAAWWKRADLRPIRIALGLSLTAAFVETVYFDHYATPVLAAVLILTVEGLRRLRQFRSPAGLWLSRTLPIAALAVAALSPAAKLAKGESMDPPGAGGRAILEQLLDPLPGNHVILVRHHYPTRLEPRWQDYPSILITPSVVEFVFNGANIDSQRIVWAHDLGTGPNQRLREYYKDRRFWLFDVVSGSMELQPYPPAP